MPDGWQSTIKPIGVADVKIDVCRVEVECELRASNVGRQQAGKRVPGFYKRGLRLTDMYAVLDGLDVRGKRFYEIREYGEARPIPGPL